MAEKEGRVSFAEKSFFLLKQIQQGG